jgi:hypothetical protein
LPVLKMRILSMALASLNTSSCACDQTW